MLRKLYDFAFGVANISLVLFSVAGTGVIGGNSLRASSTRDCAVRLCWRGGSSPQCAVDSALSVPLRCLHGHSVQFCVAT